MARKRPVYIGDEDEAPVSNNRNTQTTNIRQNRQEPHVSQPSRPPSAPDAEIRQAILKAIHRRAAKNFNPNAEQRERFIRRCVQMCSSPKGSPDYQEAQRRIEEDNCYMIVAPNLSQFEDLIKQLSVHPTVSGAPKPIDPSNEADCAEQQQQTLGGSDRPPIGSESTPQPGRQRATKKSATATASTKGSDVVARVIPTNPSGGTIADARTTPSEIAIKDIGGDSSPAPTPEPTIPANVRRIPAHEAPEAPKSSSSVTTQSCHPVGSTPEAPAEVTQELTLQEQEELAERERRIEGHELAVFVLAEDLRAIRDKRLYRGSYKTFEAYLRKRWGWSRGRAYQLMDAAAVAQTLSTRVDILKPRNEKQLRPLVGLSPEQQCELWEKAVQAAGGAQPSATQVRKLVYQYLPQNSQAREGDSDNGDAPAFSAHEAWSRLEKTLTKEVGKWPGSQLGELAARLSNFAATLNRQPTEEAA